MMKDITIITFDEMEEIRHNIESMINEARTGVYGGRDGETVCGWLLEDLYKLRDKFNIN